MVDQELRHGTIGRFLRRKRLEANLTQWDVAQHLGYSTPQFVSNWERGVSAPPLATWPRLCKILRVSDAEVVTTVERYWNLELKQNRKILVASLKNAR